MEIFEKIENSDDFDSVREILNINENVNLSDMILQYIPVVNPLIRKDFQGNSQIKKGYISILNLNNEFDVDNNEKKLQTYSAKVHTILKNIIKNSDNTNNLISFLSDKNGHFRKFCFARRVNYCIRSVIAPDPYLHITNIKIPQEFIKLLNIKYENSDSLNENKISNFERKKIIKYFLLNRQPSLHKLSILGVECIENINNRLIYMNPLINPPFNADFDGDEMNAHYCISPLSKKNVEEKVHVKNNLTMSKNSMPTFKFIQDIQVGMYMISKDKNIDEKIIYDCLIYKFYKENHKKFKERILKKYNDKYTGSNLLSIVFPPDFTYKNNDIVIINGKVSENTIFNSKNINDNIMNYMINYYKEDPNIITNFISNMQKLVLCYLKYNSITISPSDCLKENSNTEIEDIKKIVLITDKEINKDLTISNNDFDKEEIFKKFTESLRTKLVENTTKYIQKYEKDSGIMKIVNSGAKGSVDNIIQIKLMIGQQIIHNKRPKELIHSIKENIKEEFLFEKIISDQDIINKYKFRGLCFNSLGFGLDSFEFYYHCQAARESIINLSQATPRSGYSGRKLSKYLENCKISDQGVVKYNNKIIKFYSSYSNIDNEKLYNKDDPFNLKGFLERNKFV
ncbi:hypothetical protein HDV06_006556 [Boothiomyces sp. JEL0866]|nr:hypothetical protein HDV06_006556 [Boothiomyces sp. JEL0866]